MVFPGVQKDTWTYARKVRQWYFHRFYDFQPDLNMANPRVREEVRRIIGYWIQLGVAGFRMDAVPFVLEKPSADGGSSQTCLEWLREFREFLQWRAGDAVLLGEANVEPKDSATYFADGDGLHLMFNFWVNQHLFYGLASGDARPLARALRETRKLPRGGSVGALPPQPRRARPRPALGRPARRDVRRLCARRADAAVRTWHPTPSRADARRARADRVGLQPPFSLPGTPVLRYGDEIGMGDELTLEGARRHPDADAMVGRKERRLSTAERLVRPSYSQRSLQLREGQRRGPAA